jgi:hypothetical protein
MNSFLVVHHVVYDFILIFKNGFSMFIKQFLLVILD